VFIIKVSQYIDLTHKAILVLRGAHHLAIIVLYQSHVLIGCLCEDAFAETSLVNEEVGEALC